MLQTGIISHKNIKLQISWFEVTFNFQSCVETEPVSTYLFKLIFNKQHYSATQWQDKIVILMEMQNCRQSQGLDLNPMNYKSYTWPTRSWFYSNTEILSIILVSSEISILHSNTYQSSVYNKTLLQGCHVCSTATFSVVEEVKLSTNDIIPFFFLITENLLTIAAWYKFDMTHIY
jgi:hypothetical protein